MALNPTNYSISNLSSTNYSVDQGPDTSFLLLQDNSSFFLLQDNSSKMILEFGTKSVVNYSTTNPNPTNYGDIDYG